MTKSEYFKISFGYMMLSMNSGTSFGFMEQLLWSVVLIKKVTTSIGSDA